MSTFHFEELASCRVAGVLVKKYRSTRTGLTVCIAQVNGPLVDGYFCLATEAHDNDGLPHTLEHLIFMGSEEYPYKGVLDLLANRCLAQGTNAWTDVDHTCYTVTTAGAKGFLNLLPIYLDHILYPTLTDSAFLTEVHHVNEKGEDAGVVYCEMQARENTSEDRTYFNLIQHMYPGKCGYKSETGGRMENLRNTCSNEKVRIYHQSFYRPDNLCLIVVGQVYPQQLFRTLSPFEEKILSKGTLPPMTRPWQSPVPRLPKTVVERVLFPTDEEADGLARIAWRGPSALDLYSMTAMPCLMEYLSETSVAPLQQELVEIEDPFCCEVEQLYLENLETCVGFTFSGVPMEKMRRLQGRVCDVMTGFVDGRRKVDMERIFTIIKNRMLNILKEVEEKPDHFFAFAIIGDFLFSKSPDQFSSRVDQLPRFKKLLKEPSTFWLQMIMKYFVEGPLVSILGCPNSDLACKITADEKARIQKQCDELGKGGLKRKKTDLENAIAQNKIPAPSSIIDTISVPGIDSIHFHPLVAMGNHQPLEAVSSLSVYDNFPVHNIPFFLQVHHVQSAFVELTVVLDTAALPKELLLYTSLYLELLFESPLLRDGEMIPYESVVKELEEDTVDMSAGMGFHGSRFSPGLFPQGAFMKLKVEADKYVKGVKWLKELLYNIQFTKERLSVVANKMINDVSRFKRKGPHVTRTLIWHQLYLDHCSLNASSMLTQLSFLTVLTSQLRDSAKDVIAAMNLVKDILSSPDNLRVFVTMDVLTVPNPTGPWRGLSNQPSSLPPSSLPLIVPLRKLLRPSFVRTRIAGVGGVDSNFLIQMTPCVTSHMHPDLPAIMVFIEYLCALEGPMWRQIRGMGLSYNYRMICRPDNGHLYFQLFKSSQLIQAYRVAKEIMSGYLSGKTPFEQRSLEAAVSGVIYELIEKEKTVADTSSQTLLKYLRSLDLNYTKDLLDAVSNVTLEDLRKVGGVYFSRLFDPSEVITAVCCNPGKVAEVSAGLKELGHVDLEVVDDLSQLAVDCL